MNKSRRQKLFSAGHVRHAEKGDCNTAPRSSSISTRSCRAWLDQTAAGSDALPELKNTFLNLLHQDAKSGGYGKTIEEVTARYAADIGRVNMRSQS
jgi:hypothetical protein